MEGNRKGFKYVKKTAAKEALAAPVVFEEIHSPKATTRNKNAESDPGPLNSGMKRKGGDDTNVNVVDSTLKGTSSSSSSSSKKPRTDEVPKGPLMKQIPHNAIADSRIQMATLQSVEGGKAHYPRIEYEPKPSQSRGISSPSSSASIKSTSHKATLLQLIDDICTIESNGLKEYAAADKGREGIISALRDVLAELPDQVSAGVADDTIFMPELNSMEKEDVGKLEQTLVTLRDQSAYLSKYEKDIAMLGEDHNLWMDGKFAEKAEKASRSGAGSELTAQTINVSMKASQYDNLLQDIESQCDRLIQEAHGAEHVMNGARKAQDELYLIYQQVRGQAALGATSTQVHASSSVKDIIRNFPVN